MDGEDVVRDALFEA
jgi:RNA polymerase sigma-70 factor (ECF subfamily)